MNIYAVVIIHLSSLLLSYLGLYRVGSCNVGRGHRRTLRKPPQPASLRTDIINGGGGGGGGCRGWGFNFIRLYLYVLLLGPPSNFGKPERSYELHL